MLAKADAGIVYARQLRQTQRVANNLKGKSWLNLPPALKPSNPTL